MLLLIPILLALLAALVTGGSLQRLAELPARNTWVIALALAIQVLLYVPAIQNAPAILHWGGAIYVAALGLALAGALRNWHLGIGVRLATLGLALNALVIAANGGYMPVNAAAMRMARGAAEVRTVADGHVYGNTRLAGPSTRLVLLSDIIPVRLPGGFGNVYSVGDAFIVVGLSALTFRATRRPPARRHTSMVPRRGTASRQSGSRLV